MMPVAAVSSPRRDTRRGEPRPGLHQAAALRPLPLALATFATLAAFAAAARTLASARLTTCLVAFWNWSKAALVAAKPDLSAFTATSLPAGAFSPALSTHDAKPLV